MILSTFVELFKRGGKKGRKEEKRRKKVDKK